MFRNLIAFIAAFFAASGAHSALAKSKTAPTA